MRHTNGLAGVCKLALFGAAYALLSACSLTPEQEAAAIEEGILSTPGAEELWATIKTEYPEDLAMLVQQLQEADVAEIGNEELGEQIGAAWLRDFFSRIGPDSVKAPAAELIVWSATEGELYTTLQRSAVNECAAMTMGEWIFVDAANTVATAAIARRNAAMVRASAAGRDNPQIYTEPGEADFNRLGDSIASTGLDPDLQATLGSDAAMAALSPAEQCEIGVAVYSGLSALPDEEEVELAAYMLSPV